MLTITQNLIFNFNVREYTKTWSLQDHLRNKAVTTTDYLLTGADDNQFMALFTCCSWKSFVEFMGLIQGRQQLWC